jgi:hypothetical protein
MVCGRYEFDVWIEKMGPLFFYSIGEVEIATDLDDSQKQMLSRTWIQLVWIIRW